MKTNFLHFFIRLSGALLIALVLGPGNLLHAKETVVKTIKIESDSTNTPPLAPVTQTVTTTNDTNDDEETSADTKGTEHSATLKIQHDDGDSGGMEDIVIPVVAIVGGLATPIVIVFLISYFKYRRRQESLALAREFLNKGLPVPQELLDPSQEGNYATAGAVVNAAVRNSSDLRKGFRQTFIGLGITLALYVTNPHSTWWGWGLIPMVMGIGRLVSAWVETKQRRSDNSLEPKYPPPGNTP